MITLRDAEKASNKKNSTFFMIKIHKIGTEQNFLNLIKACIYESQDEHRNSERLKTSSLR